RRVLLTEVLEILALTARHEAAERRCGGRLRGRGLGGGLLRSCLLRGRRLRGRGLGRRGLGRGGRVLAAAAAACRHQHQGSEQGEAQGRESGTTHMSGSLKSPVVTGGTVRR